MGSPFTEEMFTIDGMVVCFTCKTPKSVDQFKSRRLSIKNDDGSRTRVAKCLDCIGRRTVPYDPDKQRNENLTRMYGITAEAEREMNNRQQGLCAICGKRPSGAKKQSYRLHVDHDHTTGKVRGLLCQSCNHGVGNFKDDPALLEAAIAYIKASHLDSEPV